MKWMIISLFALFLNQKTGEFEMNHWFDYVGSKLNMETYNI